MRLCVLSSGSDGNCLWLEAAGARLLVDAGLSLKETRLRCSRAGLDLRDLSGILLTHEHGDHAHSAAQISRKLGAPVYATRGTFGALRDAPPEELQRPLRAGHMVELTAPLSGSILRVLPHAIPHDAAEPVALSFEEEFADGAAVRAAVVNDLGHVPGSLAATLGRLDALVLEMNHDVRLLLEGPYPFSVKRRIHGPQGHLSNAQGAALLAQLLHRGLRQVVLAHLSDRNNSPSHALRAAAPVLERAGSGASLTVAAQAEPLHLAELRPKAAASRRPRQLALF